MADINLYYYLVDLGERRKDTIFMYTNITQAESAEEAVKQIIAEDLAQTFPDYITEENISLTISAELRPELCRYHATGLAALAIIECRQ